MKKHFISMSSIFLLVLIGKLFISSSADADNTAEYQKLFENRYKVFALNTPGQLFFAGERVPLENEEVKERFDRELHVNTYWQSNTLLMMKRANKYFPVVRPILKKYGIPDDFKYLPFVESGFQDVVSPSGAEGPWQFLAATAKGYGLEVKDDCDERYHVVKSTEAACKYFRDAYKVFHNWALVAASYNAGISAIQRQIRKQDVESYYDLQLNNETSRYVLRLVALKEIMDNPDKYGFQYRKFHLYQNTAVRIVEVDSTIPDLVKFAKSNGITYKDLKTYNPWLRSDKLIASQGKVYTLKIPKPVGKSAVTVEEDLPVYDLKIPRKTFFIDTPQASNKNPLKKDSVSVAQKNKTAASPKAVNFAAKPQKLQ